MAPTDMADTTHGDTQDIALPLVGERDIVFACPACSGELIVDREGAGMDVPCPHCGEPLTIPNYQPAAHASASIEAPLVTPPSTAATAAPRTFDFTDQSPEQLERRAGELKHQLKENRSQDTEMRGHVNRATMELHRLQLRLKKLQERQVDIEAELAALAALAKGKT